MHIFLGIASTGIGGNYLLNAIITLFVLIIYYSINDRHELKNKWNKWKNKKNTPELLPKSKLKRFLYYSVFDRNKIKEKIFKK